MFGCRLHIVFQYSATCHYGSVLLSTLKTTFFILAVVLHFHENGILTFYSNFVIHHVHTVGQLHFNKMLKWFNFNIISHRLLHHTGCDIHVSLNKWISGTCYRENVWCKSNVVKYKCRVQNMQQPNLMFGLFTFVPLTLKHGKEVKAHKMHTCGEKWSLKQVISWHRKWHKAKTSVQRTHSDVLLVLCVTYNL